MKNDSSKPGTVVMINGKAVRMLPYENKNRPLSVKSKKKARAAFKRLRLRKQGGY